MLKKRAIASTKRVDCNGGLHPTASAASRTTAPAVAPACSGTTMEAERRDFFSKLADKSVYGKDNVLSCQSRLRYRMKLIGTWQTLTCT